MVVQHNLTAMNSNRMLGITTSAQAKSTEKLSSGYKINRAADDAAGLSISEKMRKQIRGLTQASLNAEDGISAVQTAEGALNEVQDMLQRMNELAVKAANGTMSENDRSYIQNEIDQLTTEIDRVAETTKFNETYLLKGDRNADRVATFSYAEAASVTFGEDVSVLYGADGTAFKNAEALEEYLKENPNAKVYKTPASAAAGDGNTGVKEVTLKSTVSASDLPTAATTYTYDGTKWTKPATSTSNLAVADASDSTVDATEEVAKLFNITGSPAEGDTITFTPAVEATKGTDYIVTQATRGNTGNTALEDVKDTDTENDTNTDNDTDTDNDVEGGGGSTPTYTQVGTNDNLLAKLQASDSWDIYVKEGETYTKVTESQVKLKAAEATCNDNTTYGNYGIKVGDVYTKFNSEAELLNALSENAVIYKEDLAHEATVYEEGADNGDLKSEDADIAYTPVSVEYGTKSDATKYTAADFYFASKTTTEEGEETPSVANADIMTLDSGVMPIAQGVSVSSQTATINGNNTDGYDISDAISSGKSIEINGETYTYGAGEGQYNSFEALVALAKEDGVEISGDATAAKFAIIPEDDEDASTFTEDAVYYDADGNKISANALSNYIEYDEDNNTVKFKADARTIYADEDATTAVTNDMLKDDIMVSKDDLVGGLELKLHVGADATADNQITVTLNAMSAKGLGVNGLKVDGANDTNALNAIETIKEAIQKVSTQRSALGAVQNRLEHTINNLDNVVENTTAAESQIRDTDMATEMVKYSNNQILAQAGQSMLAQANQSNQGVLSLLG